MKFKFLNLFNCLLILSVLVVSGCQSDDDVDPAESAEMSCKIDGTDWTAVTPTANIISGVINVSGIASNDQVITMTISGDAEGTYSLDPTLPNAVVHTETSDGSSLAFASNQNQTGMNFGSVIVSEIDTENKVVSGTFETDVHRIIDGEVRVITDGVFTNIPYAEELMATESTLSASVDGTLFQAVSVSGFNTFGGNLTINGSDGAGSQTIGLVIPEDITEGTYTLGSVGSQYVAQYNPNGSTFLSADSGTLTISEHQVGNKKIKGTFSFEASEFLGSTSASITSGSFDVTYF